MGSDVLPHRALPLSLSTHVVCLLLLQLGRSIWAGWRELWWLDVACFAPCGIASALTLEVAMGDGHHPYVFHFGQILNCSAAELVSVQADGSLLCSC